MLCEALNFTRGKGVVGMTAEYLETSSRMLNEVISW